MDTSLDPAARAPLVRLPSAALAALYRALAQGRSAQESAALVRELGFESGAAFHGSFAQWLQEREPGAAPEALPADRFWERLGEFFSSLGWGTLRLEQPHAGVVSLSSDEWAEADPEAGADQPTCHLTTGILADLLGRVAGTDLAVMEVDCRSRGDRRCRFLVGSPAALGLLHERIRSGDAVDEALPALG